MSEDKSVLSQRHQELLDEICGHQWISREEYAKSKGDPNAMLEGLLVKLREYSRWSRTRNPRVFSASRSKAA